MDDKELNNRINILESMLSEVLTLLKSGSFPTATIPDSKLYLFDWLDTWMQEYKAPNLSDNGYDMANSIRKHIKPNIINKPLNQYDGSEIQSALNLIPSKRMGQIVYSIFNQCFAMALKLGHITFNPVDRATRPKHNIEQGRALTVSEHKQFLRQVKKSDLANLFRFYLLTGCRKSEALSIRWEDVTSSSIKISGTKTKNAIRTLPLLPQVKQLLKSIPKTDEYIFPYGADKVRYEFEKIRDALSFQDFTIHDLRHTFATRCLENGIALKTVQKWLGHADYMTTANIYSHITTDFEYEEMTRFSKNIIA